MKTQPERDNPRLQVTHHFQLGALVQAYDNCGAIPRATARPGGKSTGGGQLDAPQRQPLPSVRRSTR